MGGNQLTTVIEAVPEPMLHLDSGGTIVASNAAARGLLGEWIQGRSYATVLRQPAILGRIETVQVDGAPGEARFELADSAGSTQFRVRISPLSRDRAQEGQGGGARVPLLLHFTDITHLREAEEMRRDFVANVSHELRTPLTAVLGFIETLRGPARDDEAARERFLSIMEDEARRMNRLVSDLLSLSRVEAAERMRPSEMVDLAAVLDGAFAAIRPAAEERGNTLELRKTGFGTDPQAGTRAMILGDRDQLMQVFLNLTENALKYGGPDKPVTVALSREAGTGSMKGNVVRVDVIDRGEGLDPQHIPRLTERFYRVDTHRSRAMGGTGLGLAIVKHIVSRHRGRLRITSEKGQGSMFSVLFPEA
ncbi:ATP-binding protein [Roseibacterium sp. SDUM158017]|uniref:ATP-binding protein n=1 Tax=Roseicyclus salinarum TaxID=3036773 RepID=UPI0024153876|nr:ATP-binding protein [Roseibacterium sp. SDUM158017]MDG4648827.1 ATP-binding protein [Roseibacterium sp. SDUM158017]